MPQFTFKKSIRFPEKKKTAKDFQSVIMKETDEYLYDRVPALYNTSD